MDFKKLKSKIVFYVWNLIYFVVYITDCPRWMRRIFPLLITPLTTNWRRMYDRCTGQSKGHCPPTRTKSGDPPT